jgi:hypothetical protein
MESQIYILKLTVYISLIIQAITGIFNVGILSLDTKDSNFSNDVDILIQLIWLGLVVQVIEGTFYIWLARSINTISNITAYRYYDWIFSTPTMLITFIVYLIYLKGKQDDENENKEEKEGNNTKKDLWYHMKENKFMLAIILVLNTIMLMFGYFGEIGLLSNTNTVLFGFIPFIAFFYLIYDNFAKHTNLGRKLFWLFSGLWSLYGVSALAPYYIKNISYNILDIFSKNFFEIFIGVKLLQVYNQ